MAIPPFSSVPLAGVIPFDNSTNGFVSEDVQSAIEEAFAGAVFNSKFNYYLAVLSSFDRVANITYADAGLRTERITSVTYSSATHPNADLVKTVYWLDVGTMNQRIDKIEYVATVLSPDSLRIVYNYSLSGIKYRSDGFYLETF